MSLTSLLSAWIEPLLPHHTASIDTEDRRQWQMQQAREAEALLRQLRAELRLMRLWKHEQNRRGEQDG